MRNIVLSVIASSLALALASPAYSVEPESCHTVRMAQPGWNDLLFTHSIATTLLDGLGYKTNNSLLGADVIFKSLENKDLDIFLGFWDPAMVEQFGPYRDKGAVETVAVNLTGAKYTFAVPTYVWEAGVKDVRDLQKFADKFGSKMYGIEPGGNKIMFDMIENPEFGLKGWKVVESSEQGMLAQVGKAIRKNEWIVFQGWAPHPMNIKYDMKYLTGADAYFGPNFGAATVSSLVRKGYQAECPNVAQLLKNLKFTIEMENEGIGSITEDKMAPEDAAIKAIKDNPGVLDSWLAGVETVDGKDGLPAVKAFLGL